MTALSLVPVTGDTQLVPVYRGTIGGVPAHVVNARELHTYLENGDKSAGWIPDRIEKYGFVEDQDFALISVNSEIKKGRGGDRRSKDYLISLDMAKELSMVENNAKGREARRYFIAMERKALEAAGQMVPASHQETLLPSEQQTLSEIVHAKVAHLAPDLQGKGLAEIWSRLHHKFRIAKYSQLPRTRIAEAILYVTQMELRGVPSTPVTPEPVPEPLSAQQYDELTRTLCPSHWLLNGDGVQTAIHDCVRVTLGVRHLKDIPAVQFAPAMLLAKDINARCQILSRVGSEFLDEMARTFLAAEAPCTLVLARQYKQRFKAEVPKYPNWLEIQQQLALKGSGTPVAI